MGRKKSVGVFKNMLVSQKQLKKIIKEYFEVEFPEETPAQERIKLLKDLFQMISLNENAGDAQKKFKEYMSNLSSDLGVEFSEDALNAIMNKDQDTFMKSLDSTSLKNLNTDAFKNTLSSTVEKLTGAISDLEDRVQREPSEEDDLLELISDMEASCDAGNSDDCELLADLYDDLDEIRADIKTDTSFDKTVDADRKKDRRIVKTVAGDPDPENNGRYYEIHGLNSCRMIDSSPEHGPAGYCIDFYDENIPPGPIYAKLD